jgi:peptidoglycan/xylan/chitin deacetylase (PgdA/CDA1 family)
MNKYKPLMLLTLLLLGCGGNDVNNQNVIKSKPQIVLTFDDDFVSNWYSIKDELILKGVTATFFISYYGNESIITNPRRIANRNKLLEMENIGFEIANHSFSHAKANVYSDLYGAKNWFSNEVQQPVCTMIEDGFSVYSFAYPHSNSNNKQTDNVLLNKFGSIRLYSEPDSSIYEGVYDYNSSLIMSSKIDNQVAELAKIKETIDYIYENNLTLILAGHDIANSSESRLYTTPERLSAIIDYAKKKGIQFIQFREINNNKLLDQKGMRCNG